MILELELELELKLELELEIDTNPPAGSICQSQIITRHRLLALKLYDLPSLMAGKIHALITRGYPKGRDWYDLLWYCGRRPKVEPNLIQLHNALVQTQGKDAYSANDWKNICLTRVKQLDASMLVKDVKPFLEHPDDAKMLNMDSFQAILSNGK